MRSVWAVARNTLAQAVRMKIAVVVFLLLLILLPLMSKVMDGDGTLLGKLQTFSSYGLSLISFLLCILTIAISAYTLNDDLKRKYIYLVVTKPIRRMELILGKLLGIVILNVFLLALFSSIVYICTVWVIPKMVEATPEHMMKTQAEFFTSRVGLEAKMDTQAIQEKALERLETVTIPEGMTKQQAYRELYGQERMKNQAVGPGYRKRWDFENVRVQGTEYYEKLIFVRYKHRVTTPPANDQVFGTWLVGDLRQEYGADKYETPMYPLGQYEPIRTAQEFPVPSEVVAEDGYLSIAFFNDPSMNRTTIIPEDITVLYKTGTFTGNYIRAVLLILVRLVFLTILGVSLSTWLSFPVAILVCLVVFFTGLTNGFIMDAIDGLGAAMGLLYGLTVKPLLWLLPRFDAEYSPTKYIVDGRTLGWAFLSVTAAITLLVKGLLMLLFGMFIFSKREIAKAVV
jgi:hypothetical protein